MNQKIETSAGGLVFKNHTLPRHWLLIKNIHNSAWTFPKGWVGDFVANECPENAALREVEEEGGVKAKIISPQKFTIRFKYRFKENLIEKTVHYFVMEYIEGDPGNHDEEVATAEFFPEPQVLELLTYKGDRDAFGRALRFISAQKSA